MHIQQHYTLPRRTLPASIVAVLTLSVSLFARHSSEQLKTTEITDK